jgi:hypothetical protein
MLHGATLKIFPSWAPLETPVDISWTDEQLTETLPEGDWSGQLALLGQTGSTDGRWLWESADRELILTVLLPNGTHFFMAHLFDFSFPLTTGMTGTGKLTDTVTPPGVVPGTILSFTWEAIVSS